MGCRKVRERTCRSLHTHTHTHTTGAPAPLRGNFPVRHPGTSQTGIEPGRAAPRRERLPSRYQHVRPSQSNPYTGIHTCMHACAVRRCLALPGHVPNAQKKHKATPLQLILTHGRKKKKERLEKPSAGFLLQFLLLLTFTRLQHGFVHCFVFVCVC